MEKSAEIGARLRKWGLDKFETLSEFASQLGIVPQNLNNYLTGKRIPGNKMKSRLRELGCDINWLMSGETSALTFDVQLSAHYPIVSHIRAGNGTIAEPQFEYSGSSAGPSGKKYQGSMFFEVKGDSMVPRWEEGDLVLVNPNVKPKHGEYGIVCWDNEDGALKKVYYHNGRIHLQSINPAYETIVVNPADVWFIAKILLTKHKE